MFTYLLIFSACQSSEKGENTGRIQAIGDSFLDFYSDEEASIPHVVGNELSMEVQNNSVSGAILLDSEEAIHSQYEPGSWDWVLVNGGGNDLEEQCACGDCDAYMDEIISEDSESGAIPDLLHSIREDGNRIVLMSYFSIPNEAEEFSNCNDELDTMRARYQGFAAEHDDVIFVDAGDVVSYDTNPEAYADDLIHPSLEGSQIIGAYVAEQLLDLE